jgi:hypothetical protein
VKVKPSTSVLLVGGSFSSLPIIKALSEYGLKLILISGDKTEPGHNFAEHSIVCDYSDVIESLKALDSIDFDYVVPSCNDKAYKLASIVASIRKLPGYDELQTCELISSKLKFREFTQSNDISSPKHFNKSKIMEDPTCFPILVKPNISFSGRGISKIFSSSEIETAEAAACAVGLEPNFTYEEFIDGTLHSVSVFISGQTIFESFFVDEFCEAYPYQVDNSNYPSRLTIENRVTVLKNLDKMIKKLNLVDGLLHAQFMLCDSGIKIIETMRRAPGDLYGNLIEYSSGFEYYKNYVSSFIAMDFEKIDLSNSNTRNIARYTATNVKSTNVNSFIVRKKLISFYPLAKCGDTVDQAPFGKSAIAFMEYNSSEALFQDQPNFGINSISQT